jgi:hypothetical protein
MQPEGSSPCAQQPDIFPQPEPDQSTPRQATLLLECIKHQKRVLINQASRFKQQVMTIYGVV